MFHLKKLQSAPWFNRRRQKHCNMQPNNDGRPRIQDRKVNKQHMNYISKQASKTLPSKYYDETPLM